MSNLARPRYDGMIIINASKCNCFIQINVNQKWQFEIDENGEVAIKRRNIMLCFSKEKFDEDFETIPKEEQNE